LALLFYNIFISLYIFGIRIASIRSNKAALWLKGRQNLFPKLKEWKNQLNENEKIIWFHCASLGEFEQGRPLIEHIKIHYPNYKIILTFFSPSGFEIRKNYQQVDAVFYLPADTKSNASLFIDIINPSLVIWVKYEYWYYFLTTLKQKNIPVVLVSGIFRKSQPFFKWYGKIWRKILIGFTQIFVQDEGSVALLKAHNFDTNIVIAGDTRFDRVISIAENNNSLPKPLLEHCTDKKVIVAGSTWEEDEELIVHYAKIHPDIKFIIAPHEIDSERLHDIKKLFSNSVLYSDFIQKNEVAQVIIIDNIGLLSSLYKLADIAYIGGGFNSSGIHNILEAAVYGKPIIFGPVYEKFSEAVALVDSDAAFSVENALELETILDKLFTKAQLSTNASQKSRSYVYENSGATNIIIQFLQANRLLIK
jgi:3-deoxy-D-manno-octulosonic-acid transferase